MSFYRDPAHDSVLYDDDRDDIQLRTIKVIKFDNLRTRIFIEILTSDSEPETSKASRNGVALIFPRFFGCAKFLGVFNAPNSVVLTCLTPSKKRSSQRVSQELTGQSRKVKGVKVTLDRYDVIL